MAQRGIKLDSVKNLFQRFVENSIVSGAVITCRKARWRNLDEVQEIYPHADPVGDCTVFNIGGNKYRLVSKIRYQYQRIYVIHVLTHKDYDKGKWKYDC